MSECAVIPHTEGTRLPDPIIFLTLTRPRAFLALSGIPYTPGECFSHVHRGILYRFCIEWAKRLVAGREPVPLPIGQWPMTTSGVEHTYRHFRYDHAMSARCDLSQPVLIGQKRWPDGNGQLEAQLIDGNHRVYKAAATGVPSLPSLWLTEAETETILYLTAGPVWVWGDLDDDALCRRATEIGVRVTEAEARQVLALDRRLGW